MGSNLPVNRFVAALQLVNNLQLLDGACFSVSHYDAVTNSSLSFESGRNEPQLVAQLWP